MNDPLNVRRTMPKVPGLNAQPLQPSIGTDHWTLHRNGVRRRNSQIRKPRPTGGAGTYEMCPTHHRPTIDRPSMDDRCKPNATPARKPRWAK